MYKLPIIITNNSTGKKIYTRSELSLEEFCTIEHLGYSIIPDIETIEDEE